MSTNHATALPRTSIIGDFLRTPINWLMIFLPITVALEHGGNVAAPLIFFSAALAIVPLWALIGAGGLIVIAGVMPLKAVPFAAAVSAPPRT